MPAAKILAFSLPRPEPKRRAAIRRLSSPVKTRPTVAIESDFPGETALAMMRKLRVPPLEKVTKPFFD